MVVGSWGIRPQIYLHTRPYISSPAWPPHRSGSLREPTYHLVVT